MTSPTEPTSSDVELAKILVKLVQDFDGFYADDSPEDVMHLLNGNDDQPYNTSRPKFKKALAKVEALLAARIAEAELKIMTKLTKYMSDKVEVVDLDADPSGNTSSFFDIRLVPEDWIQERLAQLQAERNNLEKEVNNGKP